MGALKTSLFANTPSVGITCYGYINVDLFSAAGVAACLNHPAVVLRFASINILPHEALESVGLSRAAGSLVCEPRSPKHCVDLTTNKAGTSFTEAYGGKGQKMTVPLVHLIFTSRQSGFEHCATPS